MGFRAGQYDLPRGQIQRFVFVNVLLIEALFAPDRQSSTSQLRRRSHAPASPWRIVSTRAANPVVARERLGAGETHSLPSRPRRSRVLAWQQRDTCSLPGNVRTPSDLHCRVGAARAAQSALCALLLLACAPLRVE